MLHRCENFQFSLHRHTHTFRCENFQFSIFKAQLNFQFSIFNFQFSNSVFSVSHVIAQPEVSAIFSALYFCAFCAFCERLPLLAQLIFNFVALRQPAHARQCSNKFGIVLAYSQPSIFNFQFSKCCVLRVAPSQDAILDFTIFYLNSAIFFKGIGFYDSTITLQSGYLHTCGTFTAQTKAAHHILNGELLRQS